MIKIKNVSKSYHYDGNTQEVLKNVSLEMERGELVAIYGQSGTGKSTLMNMIAALDLPDSGEVYIDDENIFEFSEGKKAKLRNQKIGFVFQSFNLISHLKAIENVELVSNIAGENIFKSRKKAEKLLTSFGLSNHMHKSISKLSGGQKQRVAIARALMNDPHIILADEPTGAVDRDTSKVILDTLKDIADSGKLVIIITHEKSVLPYATKVVHLKDGECSVEIVSERLVAKNNEPTKLRHRSNILNMCLIALKNIFKRPFKNGLYALTSSLTITMALLIAALNVGIVRGLDRQMEDLKVSSNKISVFMPEGQRLLYDDAFMDYAVEFQKIDGVESVYLEDVNMTGYIYDKEGLFLNAHFDVYARGYHMDVEYGRAAKNGNEVVITQQLAESVYGDMISTSDRDDIMNSLLNKSLEAAFISDYYNGYNVGESLKLGEEVDYLPIKELEIVGILPTSAIKHRLNVIKNIVYVTNDLVQGFYGQTYSVPAEFHSDAEPSDENINVIFNVFIDREGSQVMRIFATDGEYETLSFIVDSIENRNDTYLTENDFLKYVDIFNVLNKVSYVLFGFVVFSIVNVLFMFGAIQYVSVTSRIKEIGILNALGINRKGLLIIFNLEAIMIAIASSLIAIQTSKFLIRKLQIMIIDYFKEIGFYRNESVVFVRYASVTEQYIMYALVGSIIIALIASIIPSMRVSNLNPIDALREE